MRLFIQCPTGISGDMFLAAMGDLGLDFTPLEEIFKQAGVAVRIDLQKERHRGLIGSSLLVQDEAEQSLRHLEDLQEIVDKCSLSPDVKTKSKNALQKLAQAEAKVHGVDLSEVHFHEIGATDTLVDVVGTFWALQTMGISRVTCSSLPWFGGYVDCAHGRLPLPAPATLQFMQDKPVYPSDFEQELITPTGALLVDCIVDSFTAGPEGKLLRSAMGWGSNDLDKMPNALRLFLFSQSREQVERIWVLETNIDHLTGEEIGNLFEELFEAGALDVFYSPGIMKKNRSGGMLQVISGIASLDNVQNSLFKHTLSLGIRRREMERVLLPREEKEYPTPWGNIRGKQLQLGEENFQKPEFDSLREFARSRGLSLVQLRYLLQEYKE